MRKLTATIYTDY